MTPVARRAAFLRWAKRCQLNEADASALAWGLARVGFYLRPDEDGGAHLHFMGGDAGEATLRGFLVLHGEEQ